MLLNNPVRSQSGSNIVVDFGRDEEDPLPEEDLILLNDVFLNGNGLSKLNLLNLSRVSIFSEEDVSILSTYSLSPDPTSILLNKALSRELKSVLERLKTPAINSVRSVHLEQMMTLSDDIRYRWKGIVDVGGSQVGFILERDPTERNVIDYGSIYIERESGSMRWIIGDHQILAGYGLSVWRNSSTRRGFDVLSSLQRSGSGLKPYRSSHEFWKIRGAAVTINSSVGDWTISLGHNSWDGTIDSTGIIKVNETGMHPLTKLSSPILDESSFTVVWSRKLEGLAFGTVYSKTWWTGDFDKLRRESGSIYLSKKLNASHFFTEVAIGYHNSFGAIAGYGFSFKNLRYLIHGRYYSRGFESFRANPVSEWSSRDEGERGVFQSLKFRWSQNTIVFYGDLYGRIQSDLNMVSPVNGFETGIRWIFKQKRAKTRLQWSSERKTVEDDPGFLLSSDNHYTSKQTFKYVYDFQVNPSIKMRFQAQQTTAQSAEIILIGQGATARIWLNLNRWVFEMDLVGAKVEDFDSRVYFWDVNLPGEMRSTMYSQDASSIGLKIVYNKRGRWYSGVRYRMKWDGLSLSGNFSPSAGIFISASV
jgi:hypothetical protein